MHWIYDERVQTAIVIRTQTLLSYIIVAGQPPKGDYTQHLWSSAPITLHRGDDEVLTYEAIIESFPAITSSLEGDANSGSIILSNHMLTDPDGNITGSYLDLLVDKTIEGRGIKAYIVNAETIQLSDFEAAHTDTPTDACMLVYQGIVDSISGNEKEIKLQMSNYISVLDNDLQYDDNDFLTEGGNNEVENTPKPFCYGECFNVSPTMVNSSFDDGSITGAEYLVDGELIWRMNQVRENGNPLENETDPSVTTAAYFILTDQQGVYGEEKWIFNGTPPSYTQTGSIVLVNGDPISGHGVITCDVTGKKINEELSYHGVTRNRSAIPIVLKLIQRAYRVNTLAAIENYIDINTFNETEILVDGTDDINFLNGDLNVGTYISSITQISTIINELLVSVRCYLYINHLNKICVGRFELYDYDNYPELKPRYIIEPDNIIQGSISLDSTEIPNLKTKVGYKKNHTIQTIDSLAFVIADPEQDKEGLELAESFGKDYQYAIEENSFPYILFGYPTAITEEAQTVLLRKEGAVLEAAARMKIREVKRKNFSLSVYGADMNMQVGEWISIYTPLFSTNGVINGTIIGLSKNIETKIIKIEVFV